MKVLITDDSEFMRAIIKTALKDIPDIEFLEAENGDVAVEIYKEYQPGIIFLDIVMPVKNGITTMTEIRQLNPDAKIVIVTSVGQDEFINKANNLKANGFIAKPFHPDQIKEVYHQLVG